MAFKCLLFWCTSGPEVINFFMLNSTENEISTAHKNSNTDKKKKFLALSLSDVVFIMLIHVTV